MPSNSARWCPWAVWPATCKCAGSSRETQKESEREREREREREGDREREREGDETVKGKAKEASYRNITFVTLSFVLFVVMAR
jgi:hypothetical protein